MTHFKWRINSRVNNNTLADRKMVTNRIAVNDTYNGMKITRNWAALKNSQSENKPQNNRMSAYFVKYTGCTVWLLRQIHRNWISYVSKDDIEEKKNWIWSIGNVSTEAVAEWSEQIQKRSVNRDELLLLFYFFFCCCWLYWLNRKIFKSHFKVKTISKEEEKNLNALRAFIWALFPSWILFLLTHITHIK